MFVGHGEDGVAAHLAFKAVGPDLMGTHVRVRLGRPVYRRRVHSQASQHIATRATRTAAGRPLSGKTG